MYNIVIATHGNLAEGFYETSKLFCGEQDIKIFKLLPQDDINSFLINMKNELEKIENDILIFTDLLGGSPNNVSLTLTKNENIHLICSLNLPMLIEAISNKDILEITEDYLDDLVSVGQEAIRKMRL